MTVFLDSSAVIAVLDRSQTTNPQAARSWRALVDGDHTVVTSSYVILEATSLVQRRYGLPAVVEAEAIWAVVDVHWVDAEAHRAAVQMVLLAGHRNLSIVDCVSLQLMQSLGIRHAFAFDCHFTERGYTLPPLLDDEV